MGFTANKWLCGISRLSNSPLHFPQMFKTNNLLHLHTLKVSKENKHTHFVHVSSFSSYKTAFFYILAFLLPSLSHLFSMSHFFHAFLQTTWDNHPICGCSIKFLAVLSPDSNESLNTNHIKRTSFFFESS